jgi:hypothetical protein
MRYRAALRPDQYGTIKKERNAERATLPHGVKKMLRSLFQFDQYSKDNKYTVNWFVNQL